MDTRENVVKSPFAKSVLAGIIVICILFPSVPVNDYSNIPNHAPAAVETLSLIVTGAPKAFLTWDDISGEDGYSIYRDNEPIAEVDEDIVSYLDTSLIPGESYRYTVRAFKFTADGYLYGPPSPAGEIRDGYTWLQKS